VYWKALALGLGLLAPALGACGGAVSSPPPTGTSTLTSPPSATATLPPTFTATPAKTSAALAAGGCPDPYPGGAPYVPTPGRAIRLRPQGTPPPLPEYEALRLVADPALEAVVRTSIGAEASHFAVVIKRLDTGQGVAIDPGRVFYAASLYKVWVMLEAFHQRAAGLLDFDEHYIVSDYYESLSLNEDELPLCSQVTASEALNAMIRVSDNVAGNIMLERVGFTNLNTMLRGFGFAVTGMASNGDVFTTADGMATLLEAIGRRQAVSPEASDEMLALLESDVINDRLPALLPPGTVVAHKTGNWSGATHDAGIVYSPNATYVIVVLTDYDYDTDGAIASLSRAVYDYYNPR
jgi:beta-lactamase class A